jgi:hypothetical protein
MQGPFSPTEDDEASIPTEHIRNGRHPNRTFTTVRRKAAKRILPWDLPIDEIQLASPSPHDEFIRETKRLRLEESAPTSLEKATTEDATTAFPLIALASATTDNDDVNADPVTQTQPNARTAGATGKWTLVEDAKLTSAVTNTRKTKHSNNWVAIAELVPDRTQNQCKTRWYNALNLGIDRVNGCTGTWKEEEDIKLKAAVQTHGVKNWVAIATLVPSRTRIQCKSRWRVLNPSIDRTTGRKCKWEEDEKIKLKDAVLAWQ